MYCPFCGIRLEQITKVCSSCGHDVRFLKEAKSALLVSPVKGPGPSQSKGATSNNSAFQNFKKYRKYKQKERRTSRSKEIAKKTVKIQVGVMTKMKHNLKPLRGKNMPLEVETNWSSEQLLAAATKKLRDFIQDMEDEEYVLLYPDGTEVKEIPGTDLPFNIVRYKKAVGKAYQRITLYICTLDTFMEKDMSTTPQPSEEENTLMESISQDEENTEGHHSGDAVSKTGSPVLRDLESDTFQSATEQPPSRDNLVEKGQEKDDDNDKNTNAGENIQKKQDQDKQEEGQLLKLEESRQEGSIEEGGQLVNTEDQKPILKDKDPEHEDVQLCDEKSGQEHGESKSKEHHENPAEKNHSNSLEEEKKKQEEETRHQDQAPDLAGLGRMNVEQHQKEQKDNMPTEMTMCDEEKPDQMRHTDQGDAEVGHKSTEEQNTDKSNDKHFQEVNKEDRCRIDQVEQEKSEENMILPKEKCNQIEEMEQGSIEDEPVECNIGQATKEEKQEWTIRTIEEETAEMRMDIDHTEEKMQLDVPENSKDCMNMENPTVRELKDEMMESSIQTPAHPVVEEEDAFESSHVLSVKVKDEPMDEEYEKALAPQNTPGTVKDEPDTSEECDQKREDEFKISAVFSVGRNSAPIESNTVSSTVTFSAKLPVSSSVPSLAPASSLCIVCSGCKKVLLKGQTAFQRKGSPQLFCSPHCLCSTPSDVVIKPAPKKICHYCLKEITNPKDLIIVPTKSAGTVKDFCSQSCLTGFNNRMDSANSSISGEKNSTKCSMCQKVCTTLHEVNFLGKVHKLCSDTCFTQFRSTNKLIMNCCVHCGGYCYSADGQCPTLIIEGCLKKFCGQNCITDFKKKYGKPVLCTMCRGYHSLVEMVESTNTEGSRELFCSATCVTAYKVQTVSSSGAAVECNNCNLVQVPQYHLALSDGTIRNFCSFNCVVTFQDSFNKTNSHNQLNVTSSLSTTQPQSAPKPASTKPVSAEPSSSGTLQIPAVTKIPCAQCLRYFFRKPELLDFKGKMYAFCDKVCIAEFRRTNYIMAQCVYCKIDKVVKEIKRINNVDCSFCSEGCKLLYKHDLAKSWGKKHCRNCLYCNCTSETVMISLFSGKHEEFCGNECLSQYTLLFCQVAKCSTCKRAKKMVESVRWLGEMKHFCSLQCLMYFCSLQGNPTTAIKTATKTTTTPTVTQPAVTQPAVTQPASAKVPISISSVLQPAVPNTLTTTQTSSITKEATPVIANVISLSSATNEQPNVLGNATLQGAVPACVKLIGNASTQTDAVKYPAAPPRILKNKALLCKPMSMNKGTSCRPNTCDMNTQTDETPPKVIVLPLPVPVFVPLPMHLYTQYTPYAVGLPVPMPVPMFLPTTLDSAERIVETIQKIKEKIPDNPLEADLIMMAEMVAEDSEKEKTVSHGDQEDNFIENFDLEALTSHLSWEEDSISSASRLGQTSEPEKAPPPKPTPQSSSPTLNTSPTSTPTPTPTPTPTQEEQQMDLEADFPPESFEHVEQHSQKEKTPRHRVRKRGRDGFPQRKRARKSTGATPLSPSGHSNITKLRNEYGVRAWKSWVHWRKSQSNLDAPKFGSRNMTLKEDLLKCSTAELSYGLSKFINEVRRPNGEPYSPDSIHYLCLGIQQHLFEHGRMENIFADVFYNKFSENITNVLKGWKPTILPSGYVHSRVEEEYLWDCKQLGAFSPSVLLNTLLYFCTKFFNFKTVAQHRRLSFAHVMRCNFSQSSSKVACLRFYPPVPKEGSSNADEVPAKRKKEDDEEDEGVVLEMKENAENPLRCPIRLYEFYLSKCSSSVKQSTNVFYLRPERSCVPNSPLWFSSSSLDDEELESMLTRILTVRELYQEKVKLPSVFDSDKSTDSD